MDTEYGLINMNARLYDPLLGRFISADSVIGDVYNPQSLNRYSYVLNNPFAYTDPTGHLPVSPEYAADAGLDASAFFGATKLNEFGYVLPANLPVSTPNANFVGMESPSASSMTFSALDTYQQRATSAHFEASGAKSSWVGTVADIGVGFTPAGIAADVYGAIEGKTLFGGQELSGWERGLGLIPFGSEAMAVFRGGIKTVGAVEDVANRGADYFRGARGGAEPNFIPRPNEFKVDPATGLVKDTHGVSVFDNAESVLSKGLTPHKVDQSTIPDTLRILQRGSDPRHYEITPKPGANLTPQQFIDACGKISCTK